MLSFYLSSGSFDSIFLLRLFSAWPSWVCHVSMLVVSCLVLMGYRVSNAHGLCSESSAGQAPIIPSCRCRSSLFRASLSLSVPPPLRYAASFIVSFIASFILSILSLPVCRLSFRFAIRSHGFNILQFCTLNLFSSSPCGRSGIDLEGGCTVMNDAYC
jgi:hypothetical protein